MRTVVVMLFTLALALGICPTAHAQRIGCRNPDVPFGGVAIDAYGAGSVAGRMEQTDWDILSIPPADGLPVSSRGDFQRKSFGLSMMTSLSSNITVQIYYDYTKSEVSDIAFTSVGGGLVALGANHALPYDAGTDAHSMKVRLRLWLGTSE